MNSRKRLDEAFFHLRKLKESQNSNIEEFEIYLNAFISSARSVTWILNTECSKSDILKLKYDSYKFEKSHDELLDLMTKLRNKSVKIEPIKVEAITYKYVVDFKESKDWTKMTPQKIFYSIEEGDYIDIAGKCEEYYSLLDSLIVDFEKSI